jgi:hypothetical protein
MSALIKIKNDRINKIKRKVKFCFLNDTDSEDEANQLIKRIKSFDLNLNQYLYKSVIDKIIYKNENIELRYNYNKKSFGVFSLNYIPAGSIICIEEGILGTHQYISSILQFRKDIAKELYPRKELDIFTSISELHFTNEDCSNKVNYNVWEWNSDDSPISYQNASILCPYISKFNHSCFPNAFVRSISSGKINEIKNNSINRINDDTNDNYKGYIIIYSIDNIKEGSEITVSYGFNIGHPSEDPEFKEYEDNNSLFNWNCDCEKSERVRYLHYRFAYREAKKWLKEDMNDIAFNYF